MLAILSKDLLLVWFKFRRILLVALAVVLIATAGLAYYGTTTDFSITEDVPEVSKLGVVRGNLPDSVRSAIAKGKGEAFATKASLQDLKESVASQELKYGFYWSQEKNHLEVINRSQSIRSLLDTEFAMAMLPGTEIPVVFTQASVSKSSNTGARSIWMFFILIYAFGAKLCGILVWEERAKGNLEELVASPVTRLEIIAAKIASVLIATLLLGFGTSLFFVFIFVAFITAAFLRNSGALSSALENLSGGNAAAQQPDAISFAGSLAHAIDFSLMSSFLLCFFSALLAITSIVVIANFLIRDQTYLFFLMGPVMVSAYLAPFFFSSRALEDSSWHWAAPILNLYFTSAYSFSHGFAVSDWMVASAVNLTALTATLIAGAFLIGRIDNWPSQ